MPHSLMSTSWNLQKCIHKQIKNVNKEDDKQKGLIFYNNEIWNYLKDARKMWSIKKIY